MTLSFSLCACYLLSSFFKKNWSIVDLQCCVFFFLISLARGPLTLLIFKESAFGLLIFSSVHLFSPVLINSLLFPSFHFLGEGAICCLFLVSWKCGCISTITTGFIHWVLTEPGTVWRWHKILPKTQALWWAHFSGWHREAQRGEVTCSRWHSSSM